VFEEISFIVSGIRVARKKRSISARVLNWSHLQKQLLHMYLENKFGSSVVSKNSRGPLFRVRTGLKGLLISF